MIVEEIRRSVAAAAEEAAKSGGRQIIEWNFTITKPREEFGDYACNIGFTLSKEWKMSPEEAAGIVVDKMELPDDVERAEVAGNGYINFYVRSDYWTKILNEIALQRDRFGWSDLHTGEKIMVEFVSANPTGPLHIGHGRYAAFGDSLARLLETQGYDVFREFYINDYGTQMEIFGKSIAARYGELLGEKEPFPEEGYRGQYIVEIAQEIVDEEGYRYLTLELEERAKTFVERAYRQVMSHLETVLASFRVVFDGWFSEKSLHESGQIDRALELLKKKELSYEKEGALWFRSSDFGDDKDRVLIRSDAKPTYFASDVAYHIDKFQRSFDRVINIWGADHHGYVPRMMAVAKALGFGDKLEIIIGQLVSLWRAGEPVRLSKRTGEIITLEELIEEVGVDVARFFLVMRGPDTAIDFDLDLAKEQSAENPVYYVQYAHARISSILRVAADEGFQFSFDRLPDFGLLRHVQETRLIKKLAEYPEILSDAAATRSPQRLTVYAQELATQFHLFYRDCRVIGDDEALSESRLFLVGCTRQVLANLLGLLGVSAPERM